MTQSKKTKTAPSEKDKKSKLVRDSFTIPKHEYATIDTLKARALTLGVAIKKSELLRAGLMLLNSLDDAGLKAALAAVPTLKTGRPSSSQPETAQVAEVTEVAEEIAELTPTAPEATEPPVPAAAPVPARAARRSRKPKAETPAPQDSNAA